MTTITVTATGLDWGLGAERERAAAADRAFAASLAASMQTSARILTQRKVTTTARPNLGAPAASDGANILLDQGALAPGKHPAQAVLNGQALMLHEIAHVLYTPRNLIPADLHPTFNVLEDSRIERLLVARFAPAAKFLTHAVATFVLNGGDGTPDVHHGGNPDARHALTWGRRYLDDASPALRSAIRAVAPHGDEIAAIVDAYLVIRPADDVVEATRLIQALHDILAQPQDQPEDGGQPGQPGQPGPEGQPGEGTGSPFHGGQHEVTRGKPVTAEEEAKDAEAADAQDDERAEEGDEAGEGDGNGGQGTSASQGDGNGQAEGEGQPGDDAQGNSAGLSSNGIGTEDAVEQAAQDAVDAVEGDEVVQRHVAQVLDQISEREANQPVFPTAHATVQDTPVGPEYQRVARDLVRHIRTLRADVECGWEDGQRHGRMNLGAAIGDLARNRPIGDWHDGWIEGLEEETSVDVVVLLDVSSSMSDDDEQASQQAGWAVAKAVEATGGKATLIVFNSEFDVIKAASERALSGTYRHVGASGGTNPHDALRSARYALIKSEAAHRVVVILTDGCWGNTERSEEVIADMRRRGMVAALLGLDGAVRAYGNHGCDHGVDLDGPATIAPAMARIVKTTLAAVTRKAAQRRA